jgi:hypothetical protein
VPTSASLADQIRYRRHNHAADPIIAVDANKPATASPRLGSVGSGDGVGVNVGSAVGVGSSVRLGEVDAGVAANVGSAVCIGRDVGGGVGTAEGEGLGVSQNGGMHGGGVGEGSSVGVGVGVPNCAAETPGHKLAATINPIRTSLRMLYISTTRCVSVERTPGRLCTCSSTTSARWRSSGNSQYAKMSGWPQHVCACFTPSRDRIVERTSFACPASTETKMYAAAAITHHLQG